MGSLLSCQDIPWSLVAFPAFLLPIAYQPSLVVVWTAWVLVLHRRARPPNLEESFKSSKLYASGSPPSSQYLSTYCVLWED